ncbi:MAG TPA: hypothetical protein VJY62_06700 [Bacteroidia bacterium]|nr:hypothetical protein [Bacteroidia bacterium]
MPVNYTQAERQVLLAALGLGRAAAIGARRLVQLLNYPTGGNQVQLRGLIKECIEVDGDLIGAATGRPAGFFRINTIQELETYVDSLENRTRSDNARRSALITSWNNSHANANINRNILTII